MDICLTINITVVPTVVNNDMMSTIVNITVFPTSGVA